MQTLYYCSVFVYGFWSCLQGAILHLRVDAPAAVHFSLFFLYQVEHGNN